MVKFDHIQVDIPNDYDYRCKFLLSSLINSKEYSKRDRMIAPFIDNLEPYILATKKKCGNCYHA